MNNKCQGTPMQAVYRKASRNVLSWMSNQVYSPP